MAHAHQGTITPRVVTLTVSDTRTEADDEGGRTLRELLSDAGASVLRHAIVTDDPDRIRAAVLEAIERDGADAVVLTGGTGVAPRDQTYEAVDALLEKRLDGFGEAFRRLSWDEVGPRAILSRAVAGTRGRAVIVALPGSVKAVRLAVTRVLGPVLPHAVALLKA
ncbi:MAG: MogA/MoaB family molybdenum cofactor biosynthesis protein [Polyangiales bacterium]